MLALRHPSHGIIAKRKLNGTEEAGPAECHGPTVRRPAAPKKIVVPAPAPGLRTPPGSDGRDQPVTPAEGTGGAGFTADRDRSQTSRSPCRGPSADRPGGHTGDSARRSPARGPDHPPSRASDTLTCTAGNRATVIRVTHGPNHGPVASFQNSSGQHFKFRVKFDLAGQTPSPSRSTRIIRFMPLSGSESLSVTARESGRLGPAKKLAM